MAYNVDANKSELQSIADSKKELIDELKDFDPIKTVATISGLMTFPELQSNAYRLETLAHVAMATCNGKRKPRKQEVSRWFREIGAGFCAMQEDPAEDVFVSNIVSPKGNFRIFGGLWEGAGFYLQQVLNVVESMPRGGGYDDIRNSIYALLTISDEVCNRAKLDRNQIGSDVPKDTLPPRVERVLSSCRGLIRFTEGDLKRLKIDADHLLPFRFYPDDREQLLRQSISCSKLERTPVCSHAGFIYLMNPATVSAAIRRFLIEKMDAANMRSSLLRGLADEFSKTFSETPMMGGRIGAPFKFHQTKNGLFAETGYEVDVGLHLHVILFLDNLKNFEESGLGGISPGSKEISKTIRQSIDQAAHNSRKAPNFKSGISIAVGCGIGRGFSLEMDDGVSDDWQFDTMSAHDFYTLGWMNKFKPLSLWRLLEAEQKVASSNVLLLNLSGMLNLIAWNENLEGHLVPHDSIPDSYDGESELMVVVDQNGLRELRHSICESHDLHCVAGVDGEFVRVWKRSDSIFEEDLKKPLYLALFNRELGFPLLYEGKITNWWSKLQSTDAYSKKENYERERLLSTWIPRIASISEKYFKNKLPKQIILELNCMGDHVSPTGNGKTITPNDIRDEINIEVVPADNRVVVTTGNVFENAFFNPDNISERALVEAFVNGLFELLEAPSRKMKSRILQEVAGDRHARQSHVFEPTKFRDFVREKLPTSPVKISLNDVATLKYGMGWQIRERKLGGSIEGVAECTLFLNSLVKHLEEDLCAFLKKIDRTALAECTIKNHEAANCDRMSWRRTSAAVLALHDDKEATLFKIVEHESRLNAVSQSNRVILEMVGSECPLTGGYVPGELDLSRLMAMVMQIFALGSWSDAMRWNAMEPRIRITPLGDVQANHHFFEQVVNPFGETASKSTIRRSVEKYESLFDEATVVESVTGKLESVFLQAWSAEFGVDFDEVRTFIDMCENHCIELKEAHISILKSDLVECLSKLDRLTAATVSAIIDKLTLTTRESWKVVPVGYRDSDRQPWRFRRRLSVLRQPIVALSDDPDPLLLVAPGLIRDAFSYTVSSYYDADFADYQIQSKEMKKWTGRSRASREIFNKEVADRLRKLGWQTEHDLQVTKLLEKGDDPKFGDVKRFGDIDVLAWSSENRRVLIMECKDVQYKKTPGEIAEQLSKFRGELNELGKPDLLRRHIDRVSICSAHLAEIAKFTNIKNPELEGHLVFRNPVPMQYANEKISAKTSLNVFSDLEIDFKLGS
ncbi:hypothetical protein [Denitrobaculum tricleocarpae]|uniref:Uncharacterized protein n=1 Tax=Denitrobaculum tricleocarpae TaxID=2591009 RepID=A0A545U2A6_9PROT|nr:hypothetical protein [Denitrobaculum tricleocarpae]TQV83607.1 hypothetical protein FKG95_03175 [Denitrobaculum tricleocarpae]